jgi:hypothetical protein
MTEQDRSEYDWNLSESKKNIVDFVKKTDGKSEADIINSGVVSNYKENLTQMFNKGETDKNLSSYKQSVLDMLKLKPQAKQQAL